VAVEVSRAIAVSQAPQRIDLIEIQRRGMAAFAQKQELARANSLQKSPTSHCAVLLDSDGVSGGAIVATGEEFRPWVLTARCPELVTHPPSATIHIVRTLQYTPANMRANAYAFSGCDASSIPVVHCEGSVVTYLA
jgi:hypothetical protein